MNELINQFELTEEQDISKVIRKVEEFDILSSKKAEMTRMLVQFNRIMTKGYDSILFGRTMLRLIGCNDAFRKAERFLVYQTDDEGNYIESYTKESLSAWYSYIDNALPQYVTVENEYREIMCQYILHSKKFEQHSISYSILYRQIYTKIK